MISEIVLLIQFNILTIDSLLPKSICLPHAKSTRWASELPCMALVKVDYNAGSFCSVLSRSKRTGIDLNFQVEHVGCLESYAKREA